MDKKLTVVEAAKLLGVSKEAIYNRLRRGTLQSVMEEGIKYIVLTKQGAKESSSFSRKAEGGIDSAYVALLKTQLDELKAKNDRLEADKERLIADKEKLLIESKEKIEAIYKERDEQLKTILSLANRQIVYAPSEPVSNDAHTTVFDPAQTVLEREEVYEEADLLDEEISQERDVFESYRDWRDLRSYLKEKGFSKKEKQHINETLEKKLGHAQDVMDKNGKLFIKKGKKLKEILGE
jgi:excisionase family DNA binding protein